VGIKDKLQSSAVIVAINSLSVIAFVFLALTSYHPVGYALATLSLIGLAWRIATASADATLFAQLILAAGLLTAYRHDTAALNHDVALVIAGTLIGLVIINQPTLAMIINRPAVLAANLPGYRADHGLLIAPQALYAANPVWVAALGIFAVANLNPWPLAALIAAGAAVAGIVAMQAIRIRLRGSQDEKRMRAALIKHDPAFLLHFSAPDFTEYHVEMWRPYLERIGKPWIIVVREKQSFGTLAAASAPSGVPVIYCPIISDLDAAVTPNMKAAFYVNNGMKNTHLVRFSQLKHIQLLHGDSDKASSFNPVTAMFDRIFVAGQAGIDRYEANGVLIPAQKFDIVGRPQVEEIKVSHTEIRDVAAPVVLYATTWVGVYDDANYSSLKIGEKIVAKLLERKVTVVLRPHPYTERNLSSVRHAGRLAHMLEEDRSRSGRPHVFGPTATTQMSLFDCANAVDAMISDVSGVASDFLYSEKPFALTNMLGESAEEFERSFPLSRAAYVIDSDASNLDEVLDQLLGTDPLATKRREVKTYYLGDFSEDNYADGFVQAARAYM
jgi:hypothetical protein